MGEQVAEPYERGWIACAEALCAFLQGRLSSVRELAERAVRYLEGAGFSSSWELDTMRLVLVTCAYLTGRTSELLERSDRYARAARDRGDHYEGTLLGTGYPVYAWLVRGDAAGARRRAREAIAGWSTRGTFVHTYQDLIAQAGIDLYEHPDGEAAWQRCRERWPALKASFMLRTKVAFLQCTELRARAAVAAACRNTPSRTRSLLRSAERDADAIERLGAPPSAPLAALVRAAVQHQRGDREGTLRWLAAAASGFDAADMALHAHAARRRQGGLIGDEGRALIEATDSALRAGFVAEPARLVAMIAPGLDAT
jgi:hypothetical protein